MPGKGWNSPYVYPSRLQQLYQPGFGSDTYSVQKEKMGIVNQAIQNAQKEADKDYKFKYSDIEYLLRKYPEFEAAFARHENDKRYTDRYLNYTKERNDLGGDWDILRGFVEGKGRSHY